MKRMHCAWLMAVGSCLLALPGAAAETAAEKAKSAPAVPQPAAEQVEMFQAMEQGQLEVRLIPKDSTQATVIFKNKTRRPLTVALPEAFAGVPVLAQVNNNNNNSSNDPNQGLGGGFGGGGLGGGGFGGGGFGGGGGGGFFNIAPEQVRKVKVQAVCLEHGKREPRAAVPYEIKPLDSFNDSPGLREVIKLLANGRSDQRVAQAAAWHFANGMSWDELARKERTHLNAPSEPYFSQRELLAALRLAEAATRAAEAQAQPSTAEQSLSRAK
jgi:hypothetical protein